MAEIKIHVFHTGEVCVASELPFGGEHCSTIKASGVFAKKSERLWLPVSAYLIEIECSHGKILFDCGWHRDMSPNGVFDKKAQVKSLGSLPLYVTNQGRLEKGAAIDEQFSALGIHPADLDLVLLSHLDCDHANGLRLVADAKQILVSKDELLFAENKTPVNRIRYNANWWRGTKMQTFDWNGTEGPAGKSYDVFGNGSLVMVNIPGHSKGLCALKITGSDGRFVLLYQVVRREFFAHTFEPSITFNNYKVYVNTACLNKFPHADCAQLLINQESRILALRPCAESERDAFSWCNTTGGRRKPEASAGNG